MSEMKGKINVQKKAEIYAASIIEVFPHIGRTNPSISLDKSITENHRMKGNTLSESEQDFLRDNLTEGKLFLLPKEEKSLRKIESQMRFCCKKRQLVLDYVLYQEYESLCNDFDRLKDEYMAMRDSIAGIWDERVREFSRNLAQYLRGCCFDEDEIGKIHKILMSQLPSKEEWYNSFRFDLEVREYPASAGTLPGMDKKWEERTADLAQSLLAEQVSKLFEKATAVLKNLQEGKGVTKRLTTLIGEAGKCLNHRIVSDPALVELAKKITVLSTSMTDDEVADAVEIQTGEIVRFADKYGIYLNWTQCPLDKEYFLSVGHTEQMGMETFDQASDESNNLDYDLDYEMEKMTDKKKEIAADVSSVEIPEPEPVPADSEITKAETEQEDSVQEDSQFTLCSNEPEFIEQSSGNDFVEPSFADFMNELMPELMSQ